MLQIRRRALQVTMFLAIALASPLVYLTTFGQEKEEQGSVGSIPVQAPPEAFEVAKASLEEMKQIQPGTYDEVDYTGSEIGTPYLTCWMGKGTSFLGTISEGMLSSVSECMYAFPIIRDGACLGAIHVRRVAAMKIPPVSYEGEFIFAGTFFKGGLADLMWELQTTRTDVALLAHVVTNSIGGYAVIVDEENDEYIVPYEQLAFSVVGEEWTGGPPFPTLKLTSVLPRLLEELERVESVRRARRAAYEGREEDQ